MSNSTVDRNLLFGLVALQNGIITREALVAAFSVWQLDKSRMLDDILLEQNALTVERKAQLQQMLAWHVEIHGHDAAQSLATISSGGAACQLLADLGDAEIQASLQYITLGRAAVGADPYATNHATVSEVNLTRFRNLRPHAKGGLGEVSVALDSELNREVALKEIQERFADDPQSRERFILEAEITGGLEHPGIVPVYGLGTYPNGRPFYAMRFIRGSSLKEALQEFHDPVVQKQTSRGDRQFQLRKLLGRFIDVCNAIEYAHSRGVLHRDLKPGNIMLGKYGETLVVDWGLAKSIDRKEIFASEGMLQPASLLSSSGVTQQGSAIGTPAYISPEQAAGRLEAIGPPSDVYSLGATLYHLLTGRLPIEEKDLGAILQRAQKGNFPPPRQHDPSIPRPLEAICLKAMALKPLDRYRNARCLADDIEHWLADEPVVAVSETLSERLGRFGRKNQGYVRAGLAGLAVVALVSVTAALLIDGQRRMNHELAVKNARLAVAESEAKTEALKLAQQKSELARLNAELAARQTKLAADERAARSLADKQAVSLRRSLAQSLLDRGVFEYQEGFGEEAIADLRRGWALTADDDPLAPAYRRILFDRLSQGQREWFTPIRDSGVFWCAAFSPDGTRLVTGSGVGGATSTKLSQNKLRLWDANTGVPLNAFPVANSDDVVSVAFSPDGTRIVAGSGTVAQLWDANTGMALGTPMLHDIHVSSLAFNPDGTLVVSGCSEFFRDSNHSVRLWDARTGSAVGESFSYAGGVRSVAFSPDGKRVLTGSNDKTMRLWDVKTGGAVGEPMRHPNAVLSAAFSPDGTRIVSCCGTGLFFWDGQTGASAGKPIDHAALCVAFSPDGTRIVSGGEDKTVRIWDAQSGAPVGEPVRHWEAVRCVAFSPDGSCISSGSEDHTLRLWDTTRYEVFRSHMAHFGPVTSLAYSRDGTRIVSASEDQTLRIWDVQSGAAIGEPWKQLTSAPVRCVGFSPDGTRIVIATMDGTLQVRNAENGEIVGEPNKHLVAANCVAFNPTGTRVVSGDFNGILRQWDVLSNTEIRTMRHSRSVAKGSAVRCLAFSPDGDRIVSGSDDQTLMLWDAQSGAAIGGPMKHSGAIFCVAFSPDGVHILSGCEDRTLRLWNTQTWTSISLPMLHSGAITCVGFSGDGTCAVSGSVDKTARLWDTRTGSSLGLPMQHGGTVRSVAFNADGTNVATGSDDYQLRLWRTPSRALDEVPRQTLDRIFKLWSGVDADSTGKLQAITEEENQELSRKLADAEPFRRFVSEQQHDRAQRLPTFHQIHAAAAEAHHNWFAAQFHLRRLLKLTWPGSERERPILNARLQRASLQYDKKEDAQALLRRTIEIDEMRVAEYPRDSRIQAELAMSCDKLGDLLAASGHLDRAIPYDTRHQQFWIKMLETMPAHTGTQRTLAASFDKVGGRFQQTGDIEKALQQYQNLLEISQKLNVVHLTVTGYGDRWRVPYSYLKIGDALVQLGRTKEGLEAYHKCVALTQALAEKYPTDDWCQRELSLAYDRLGDANVRQMQLSEAWKHYHLALQVKHKRTQSQPNDVQAHRELESCYEKLGGVEIGRCQFTAARREYEQGLAVVQAFTARTRQSPFEKQIKDLKELISFCDAAPRVMVDLDVVLAQQDKSIVPKWLVMRVQCLLAYSKFAGEDLPETIRSKWPSGNLSVELLREAILTSEKYRKHEPADKLDLYNAGCCFSMCLKSLMNLELSDKDHLQEELQAKAIEALNAAATAGWDSANFTAQDPDLEPLRELPEFKTLLEHMRAKAAAP